MTEIPVGYGRATWHMVGFALPLGAVVTQGVAILGDPDRFDDGIDDLATVMQDAFEAICTDAVTLDRVELKLGPSATGPTYSKTLGVAGGGTGTAAAPNISILVHERVSGVSGRLAGRQYWPGFDKSNAAADGTLLDLAAYQGVFEDLKVGFESVDLPLRVLTTLPEGPRVVSGLDVDTRLATQRRRLRR